MSHKVFLGGTCGNSTWRSSLIPKLKLDYFNPVVSNWTEDCIANENLEKESKCDIHLYVIDSNLRGVYSIAEMVQSSNDPRKLTVVNFIDRGFTPSMMKSIRAVGDLIRSNGGEVHYNMSMEDLAKELNRK